MSKRILTSFLSFLFIASMLVMAQGQAAANSASPIILKGTTPITAGAVLKEYHWETTSGPNRINVIEVDLRNPYIELGVIPGKGKITERLNVTAMAKNTGAVAAVNGDFYNMTAEGSPFGPVVMKEQLVVSPINRSNLMAIGITSDREAYIDYFSFSGAVTAPNGATFSLTGLNKTFYRMNPDNSHSHQNRLQLYDDMWGRATRGEDGLTVPTEMLIGADGRVEAFAIGEYFDFAVPTGKKILRADGTAAEFLLNNFQVGDVVDLDYQIDPDRNWSMLIGGHNLLLDQGKPVTYTKDLSALEGVRARTVAAISQDRKTVYLIGVEGRTAYSKGLRLKELSQFCEHIGAWQALNLDGGGSTTMAARPLGQWEAKQVFSPEQVNERLVVNALGVYTTAPKGNLNGILVAGDQLAFIGEEVALTVRAYDQFYNPMETQGLSVEWSNANGTGIMVGNIFQGLKAGISQVTAKVNGFLASHAIEVVGKENIKELTLTAPVTLMEKGKGIQLTAHATTFAGNSRKVPAELLEWQLHHITGSVSPTGVLTIDSTEQGKQGFVVASYNGYTAPLPVIVAEEKPLTDLGNLNNVSYIAYPENVQGRLALTANPANAGEQVLQLHYDFTEAVGTAAAYVVLGQTGIPLDKKAESLSIDVYGNGGNQWLRAEVVDGAGQIKRIDLAPQVNWQGWKKVNLNLASHQLQGGQLNRIYVASAAGGDGQRQDLTGSLLFKDLMLKYAPTASEQPTTAQVQLTIGKKQVAVNGQQKEIDVAPLIDHERTLVPLRFITEAMDCQVLWDGASKNITVIQGRNWIDLWPENDTMIVNGKAHQLEVAPKIINDRTLVPLRDLAETLGLQVDWEPTEKKITLTR